MKLLKDKKILVISSEVVPYLPQTEKAVNSFTVSRKINDYGGMTRIFMPKYGIINERRHQLHEVIRLSGMNMIINDLTPKIYLVRFFESSISFFLPALNLITR